MPLTDEKNNASQFPQFYYARHMQTGIAKYENETILVDTDSIKRMLATFAGKPVYILHQDVDLDLLKDQACGYITDSFYNELDGWAWVKMMIIDDAAHQAIMNKWSVSNAYLPTETGPGGTNHNCEYDRKIVNGEFTHLAIVPNPRYEDAIILNPEQFRIYQEDKRKQLDELKNSKPEKKEEKKGMFNFMVRKDEEVQNTSDITDETFIIHEGRKVTVKEIKSLLNAKKNADDMAEDKKDAEDEEDNEEKDDKENAMCDIDGEKVNMKDLKNAWRAKKNMKKNEKKNKKNADADMGDSGDEFDNEGDDDDRGDDKKEKRDEKKNAHFEEMKNAHKSVTASVKTLDLGLDKLARGQAKYGSKK